MPGSIVNVISIAELGGQPYLAPYVAAKAGLAGATRNAAHAHRWDKIRINGLDIGWTATEGEAETQRKFHGAGDDWLEKANASVPMGKLGQVDEIAEFVVFLLSTGAEWSQARSSTGTRTYMEDQIEHHHQPPCRSPHFLGRL